MADKLVSVLGLMVFISLAWVLSGHRKLFPWRTVLCGLALQFGFALFILKTPWGRHIFEFLQRAFNRLGDFATEGARMVFGPLADPALMADKFGAEHAF